jgi:hypothetical protein
MQSVFQGSKLLLTKFVGIDNIDSITGYDNFFSLIPVGALNKLRPHFHSPLLNSCNPFLGL